MASLTKLGPMFEHLPEPEKSYVICPKADEENARAAFQALDLSVKYCRGHRYVGGYVGSTAMRDRWITPQVDKWVGAVKVLAKVAARYPQSAYVGFTMSLQAEWQYLCRCVPVIGPHLQPIEEAITSHLLPALMAMDPAAVNDNFLALISHGVKQGGLNIRNPVDGSEAMHEASKSAVEILAGSRKEGGELDLQHHQQCVRKAGATARKLRADTATAFVTELKRSGSKAEKNRAMRRTAHPTAAQVERQPPLQGGVARQRTAAIWPQAKRPV